MNKEQKAGFIIEILFIFVLLALAVAFFKWILPWTLPFVLGFGVALIINRISNTITKRLKLRHKYATIYATVFVYLPVVLILWIFCTILFTQTSAFLLSLPQVYTYNILPSIERFFSLPVFSHTNIWDTFDKITGEMVATASSYALTALTSLAKKLPNLALTIIFTILSSFLIALDYKKVTGFIVNQVPPRMREAAINSKNFLISSLLKMVKAYAIIFFLTFSELAFGLWLLKVDYFLTISLFTAFMDMLPVVGTGIVLISWGILEGLSGNYPLAIGLVVLWTIITVVREIVEPKIVSSQIGLHPLATLMAMFFGLQAAGFWGLLLAPMVVLLIKFLKESGYIKLYK